jgi:hypothetical protein
VQIDAEIVEQYVQGRSPDCYSDSWVFQSIEDNQYLFEKPDPQRRPLISKMNKEVKKQLDSFVPFNQKIWDLLFPQAANRLQHVVIKLVVGCPKPYGAMTRIGPDQSETMIFDLIRLYDYTNTREQIPYIIRKMLTHECLHLLLHQDYSESDVETYQQKLDFLLFDEGLAHFLSMDEHVDQYQWNGIRASERRKAAFHDFAAAYTEERPLQQRQNLIKACAGSFWGKFACIAGMFLFAYIYKKKGVSGLCGVYHQGWKNFSKRMQ